MQFRILYHLFLILEYFYLFLAIITPYKIEFGVSIIVFMFGCWTILWAEHKDENKINKGENKNVN